MKRFFAVALVLQAAFGARVDEDPDAAKDQDAAKALKKLDEAKNEAAQAASNLAGAVTDQNVKGAVDGEANKLEIPTEAPPPITVPQKPKIDFIPEVNKLHDKIDKQGLYTTGYDTDGSGDLDRKELRKVVHDLDSEDPIAKSDAELDRLHKTYDEDKSGGLTKEEVVKLIAANPTQVARMNVEAKACNGWEPEEGEMKGKGGACGKWGYQSSWCWVPDQYRGPGYMRMQESEAYPGKFFAFCVPAAVPAAPAVPANPPEQEPATKEAMADTVEIMKAAENPGAAPPGEYEYTYYYTEVPAS